MIVCVEREEVDEMDVSQSFTVVADQEGMFYQESTLGIGEQQAPSGDEVTK